MFRTGAVVRAALLAALAAILMATRVFVADERVSVQFIEAAISAADGMVRINTAGYSPTNDLRPPFALIARIRSEAAGPIQVSITADGAPVCEREVAGGGARRLDCAIAGTWPRTSHEIVVSGPREPWTLEYLELATHHGYTTGIHTLHILPSDSTHYVRPGPAWVLVAWLVLTTVLLVPLPRPLPLAVRLAYRTLAGLLMLELVLVQVSPWVSDYRVVMSAGTFVIWIALITPQSWDVGYRLTRTGRSYLASRPAAKRFAQAVVLGAAVVVGGAVLMWEPVLREPWLAYQAERAERRFETNTRRLFADLQPVALLNCDFERFGEPHDGGYVLCANLLDGVETAYSYGISGYDQWGCDVSTRLGVPVHQYDCFNLSRPACPMGRPVFHEECLADGWSISGRRLFDTIESQMDKNGDGAKHAVVKIDVEGAEWESLLKTPDAVFERIDQLTIELHGIAEPDRFLAVLARLRTFFHVASLHFNNFTCKGDIAPFPADVYEVLLVSKRLARTGGSGPAGAPPALLATNHPNAPDCQAVAVP